MLQDFSLADIPPEGKHHGVGPFELERQVRFQEMKMEHAFSKQKHSMKRYMQFGKGKALSGNSENSLARAVVLKTDTINCWGGLRNSWRRF